MRWPRARRSVTGLLAIALGGCAYYNGMWSAERLARDARRQEARGQTAQARLSWGRAASKAESVLVHHPGSRWADAALVLQGEGLARSGVCAAAARPLDRALREVDDPPLRERAVLAAAQCALEQGVEGEAARFAERVLQPVLASRDSHRRAQAAYLAGQAARSLGDAARAATLFARSDLPAAAPSRVGALAAAGFAAAAVAAVDSLASRDDDEARWAEALAQVGASAGADTAADALDRLLARGRLRTGSRTRLLIADGDRLRRARRFERAAERYAAVVDLAPDSAEAATARVHAMLAVAAQARAPADLDSVAVRLARLPVSGGEARELGQRLDEVRAGDGSEVTSFRAAEVARDVLEAPALAAELFHRFVARHPTSLFAPKALIAAAQLDPERADSVRTVLRSRYAESPYVLALQGTPTPAFEALEDSLAGALGLSRPQALAARGTAEARFAAPRPGPRGPDLEPPAASVPSLPTAPRRAPAPRRPDERPAPLDRQLDPL